MYKLTGSMQTSSSSAYDRPDQNFLATQCSSVNSHAQVGTATLPFAYEAAIGAGTLATTAAIFYQSPSLKSARTLFRFSILFLPAFMLGLVVHRVPNDHSVTFATLQEKLVQVLGCASCSRSQECEWGWHTLPGVVL